MEEKKIKVVINSETIELESNNPDLKSLINLILSQEENFNFDTIEIKTDDDKFDKDSFKETDEKEIHWICKDMEDKIIRK